MRHRGCIWINFLHLKLLKEELDAALQKLVKLLAPFVAVHDALRVLEVFNRVPMRQTR